MHKILVIRLYFPLDALHVSDYISPSSGATFYKLYIAFGICRYHTSGCCVAIAFRVANSLDLYILPPFACIGVTFTCT